MATNLATLFAVLRKNSAGQENYFQHFLVICKLQSSEIVCCFVLTGFPVPLLAHQTGVKCWHPVRQKHVQHFKKFQTLVAGTCLKFSTVFLIFFCSFYCLPTFCKKFNYIAAVSLFGAYLFQGVWHDAAGALNTTAYGCYCDTRKWLPLQPPSATTKYVRTPRGSHKSMQCKLNRVEVAT